MLANMLAKQTWTVSKPFYKTILDIRKTTARSKALQRFRDPETYHVTDVNCRAGNITDVIHS